MDLACFHIPDFAAWALARRWGQGDVPEALVVCSAGRVLSCSPALQRRGVAVGDPVDRARRLAPEAAFLLRDLAVEQALWDHLLFRLYSQLTPQVQAIPDPLRAGGRSARSRRAAGGQPEPVDPAPGLWDNGAWAWLEGADRDGLAGLAGPMGARVGVGSSRSWALLAAAYADPGGVTAVPGHMVEAFLRQAPVSLLLTLRFSADLVERLRLFGIRAVGHAVYLTRSQLAAQFGAEGARLFDLLHPSAAEPPVPAFDPRVVDDAHDFDWPVFEPGELQPVLHHLLARLVTRLDGRSARHLEVRLHGRGDSDRTAGRILKEPTGRLDVLRTAADGLLLGALTGAARPSGLARGPARLHTAHPVPGGRSVQRLAVTLSGLTEVPPSQGQLFVHHRPDLRPLVRAMDARFPGKLLRPVRAHADPFFPEEEYRFEPVAR